jgi:hypothetical protein
MYIEIFLKNILAVKNLRFLPQTLTSPIIFTNDVRFMETIVQSQAFVAAPYRHLAETAEKFHPVYAGNSPFPSIYFDDFFDPDFLREVLAEFPDPLTCPEGRSRKSLALYYYTNGRPKSELKASEQQRITTTFAERKGIDSPTMRRYNTMVNLANRILPAGIVRFIKKFRNT